MLCIKYYAFKIKLLDIIIEYYVINVSVLIPILVFTN